ncbi:MAG: Asp-tRNA(Asn)/Glu-tRNA(Gln) amidotransferase subunit GatB [Bdellovibrionaceae bacterium]|nr:Asp-tRNA(Asn)/Glu-tRNA(Gln) amidotransferase subunit GatB [Pseudobdellovibrionaceae bacterium]
MAVQDWQVVIGLEIHAQLSSKTKMFSSDSTEFGQEVNKNTSPTSLGLPGALPTINKKAVELGVKMGLALNCDIRKNFSFSRKNYFYPDLPKAYQISQHQDPVCEKGYLEIFFNGEFKKIAIERAHLEEDAGKSLHKEGATLVDFNRSGVPLLEIVSEAVLTSPKEAAEYSRQMRQLLLYTQVCDGNLQEGSMRCDCNISLCKPGEPWGTKVEIKNINSFKFIEKALDYEIKRQAKVLESGEKTVQETRLYDVKNNVTVSMRAKEDAHDYRYFPDPDLLSVCLEETDIQSWKKDLPELPIPKMQRFIKDYQLKPEDAFAIAQNQNFANFFEKVATQSKNFKSSYNWMVGDVLKYMNEEKKELKNLNFSSSQLAQLISLIDQEVISGKIAKLVFADMMKTGKDPEAIVEEKSLKQITDEKAILHFIEDSLKNFDKQLQEYRSGQTKLFGFFVGTTMKASEGKINPALLNKLLKQYLDK